MIFEIRHFLFYFCQCVALSAQKESRNLLQVNKNSVLSAVLHFKESFFGFDTSFLFGYFANFAVCPDITLMTSHKSHLGRWKKEHLIKFNVSGEKMMILTKRLDILIFVCICSFRSRVTFWTIPSFNGFLWMCQLNMQSLQLIAMAYNDWN